MSSPPEFAEAVSITLHLCESCGHPAHHCATVGGTCGVVTIGDAGTPAPCPCPSMAPASPDCACAGEMPWLRQHQVPTAATHWSAHCRNDYPDDDPNRCRKRREVEPGRVWRCRKRVGHDGRCSTHNDCGARPASGGTCGRGTEHAKEHPTEESENDPRWAEPGREA